MQEAPMLMFVSGRATEDSSVISDIFYERLSIIW